MFLSVAKLHDHSGGGAAEDALNGVFGASAPTGSALSQMRDLVSSEFFKDTFNSSVSHFCQKIRPTWNSFYITSIDGDQFNLPRNVNTLSLGYKGAPCGPNTESFGLKMYSTMACDAITGAPITIKIGKENDELHSGIAITKEAFCIQMTSKKNNIRPELNLFLYDRLYMCTDLLETHKELGSSFIVRCKKSTTFSEIINFSKSSVVDSEYEIRGHKIRLVKANQNGVEYVYATNIFSEKLTADQISWLYFRRWEIETTNRNVTIILGLERFHSSKVNGILQEIYSSLWTLLIAKCAGENIKNSADGFYGRLYCRQNTKRVRQFIMDNVVDIFNNYKQKIIVKLELLCKETTRNVERLKRSYPRIRKYIGQKDYPTAGEVPRA